MCYFQLKKKIILISNYQITNITKRIWKVLFGKNINFCWSFQKKIFFCIFDESKCSSLFGKIKYDFHKHINISTKNEYINKENIQRKSLWSHLSKDTTFSTESQKLKKLWSFQKKFQKMWRCFVHNCIKFIQKILSKIWIFS